MTDCEIMQEKWTTILIFSYKLVAETNLCFIYRIVRINKFKLLQVNMTDGAIDIKSGKSMLVLDSTNTLLHQTNIIYFLKPH